MNDCVPGATAMAGAVLVKRSVSVMLDGDQVKLWWPWEFGGQPMYRAVVTYRNAATHSKHTLSR